MPRPKAKPGKPDKAKAKAKKPAEAKMTLEKMSFNDQQRLLNNHVGKLLPALANEKSAKAAVDKIFELAKKDGFDKKFVKLAVAIKQKDDAAQAWIDAQKRGIVICKMMRFDAVDQLELFAKESSSERAFEDGRLAALQDEPAKPPTHLPTTAAKNWLDGHAAGLKQLSLSRAQQFESGFRSIAEVAGGTLGDIGDAPPTDHDVDEERKAA